MLKGNHEREILRTSENDLDSSGSKCGKPENRLHDVTMACLGLFSLATESKS